MIDREAEIGSVSLKEGERSARELLLEYLAGECDDPLVLDESCRYTGWDVPFPTLLSKGLLAWRYLLIWIARLTLTPPPLKRWLLRSVGVKIGSGVCIAPFVRFDFIFPSLIEIADGCILGEGCRIFTHEYSPKSMRVGRVRVGKGAVLGAYSTIRCGVTIGAGATVGFNSFVNRDVPEGTTVGGVPARVLSPKAGDP